MSKICVLGCGPAGLLAVHAFSEAGHRVECISKKVPSTIGGAQFLHKHIPGLCMPPDGHGILEIKHQGTKETYAQKVYGDHRAPCSWDEFSGKYAIPIWYMRHVYEDLWRRYGDDIIDGKFLGTMLPMALEQYDLVVSSIPLNVLFPEAMFMFVTAYIQQSYDASDTHDSMTYNGDPAYPWYRRSVIEGYTGLEFGRDAIAAATDYDDPPLIVRKPLTTNVEEIPEDLMLVGRYGKWQKGVLVHDAYFECDEKARLL